MPIIIATGASERSPVERAEWWFRFDQGKDGTGKPAPGAKGAWREYAQRMARAIISKHGCSPGEADEVMARCLGDEVSERSRRDAITLITGTDPGTITETVKPDPFDPAKLAAVAARLPFEMSSKWIIEHSPTPVAGITPSRYLDLIHPGRKVVVLNRYKSKGGVVYDGSNTAEMESFASGNLPDDRGKAGAWFVSNAVNGEWIDGSIRSEANLTNYGYAVLESDVAPAAEWCAMLVQEKLAIVSLVFTGSDSVHALIRVPTRNKQEFSEVRRQLIERYSSVGADPAAIRTVQLTRLPGVRRSDNGKVQRLLWLNPGAIAKPIWTGNEASPVINRARS